MAAIGIIASTERAAVYSQAIRTGFHIDASIVTSNLKKQRLETVLDIWKDASVVLIDDQGINHVLAELQDYLNNNDYDVPVILSLVRTRQPGKELSGLLAQANIVIVGTWENNPAERLKTALREALTSKRKQESEAVVPARQPETAASAEIPDAILSSCIREGEFDTCVIKWRHGGECSGAWCPRMQHSAGTYALVAKPAQKTDLAAPHDYVYEDPGIFAFDSDFEPDNVTEEYAWLASILTVARIQEEPDWHAQAHNAAHQELHADAYDLSMCVGTAIYVADGVNDAGDASHTANADAEDETDSDVDFIWDSSEPTSGAAYSIDDVARLVSDKIMAELINAVLSASGGSSAAGKASAPVEPQDNTLNQKTWRAAKRKARVVRAIQIIGTILLSLLATIVLSFIVTMFLNPGMDAYQVLDMYVERLHVLRDYLSL